MHIDAEFEYAVDLLQHFKQNISSLRVIADAHRMQILPILRFNTVAYTCPSLQCVSFSDRRMGSLCWCIKSTSRSLLRYCKIRHTYTDGLSISAAYKQNYTLLKHKQKKYRSKQTPSTGVRTAIQAPSSTIRYRSDSCPSSEGQALVQT
jgi:hypothetical protein